jgi:hypothetical protein
MEILEWSSVNIYTSTKIRGFDGKSSTNSSHSRWWSERKVDCFFRSYKSKFTLCHSNRDASSCLPNQMLRFVFLARVSQERQIARKWGETRTLSEHILIKVQAVLTCVNVIAKSKLNKSTSNMNFDQSMLHHPDDAFDAPWRRFVIVHWKLVIHFLCEIAEKTQVMALKYVGRVWMESYDFRLMIREHL